MDFGFTEEQGLLRQTVRDFIRRECPREYAREIDEQERYPFDIHKKMAELGWLGLGIPEEYGGCGGDLLTLVILVEELSRGMLAAGNMLFRNVVNAGFSILRNGTEEQKQYFLPRLTKGELLFAFSLTEPNAGSDAAAIITSAAKNGNEYVIDGDKVFCTGAEVADYIQVATRTNKAVPKHKGISVFLVNTKTPGITLHRVKKIVNKAMATSQIFFDQVRVPEGNLLGKLDGGWAAILKTLDFERICVAAMCLGVTQTVLDDALQYAQERVQFGQPIGKFQVIQHKLADMKARLEAARLLTYRAAWMAQQDMPCTMEASLAKLVASENYVLNSMDGMQILGGYGLTMEYDMQRFFRDAREFTIGAGTSEILRNIIARLIGL